MITRAQTMGLVFPLAMLAAGQVFAAENPALLKDLTAVIALLGQPCGQVVSAKRQADNDHIASCSNGNRYRLYVNAENRVVAQKQ